MAASDYVPNLSKDRLHPAGRPQVESELWLAGRTRGHLADRHVLTSYMATGGRYAIPTMVPSLVFAPKISAASAVHCRFGGNRCGNEMGNACLNLPLGSHP